MNEILTEADRQSVCWQKIEKYLKNRRETLRRRNDNDLDPAKTQKLRGQIHETKSFLALGTNQLQPEANDER